MKIKKSLVKVIVIGSIFFISSMSFGGLISLQDDNLNAFWSVSKLNTSFISNAYAESGGGESGGYKKESGDYKRNIKTNVVTGASSTGIENTTKNTDKKIIETPKGTSLEPIVDKRKKVELSVADKEGIKVKFEKLNLTIDEKYTNSEQKLDVYNRLAFLVDKNISILIKVKNYITDEALLEKYEKKILLFKELSILTHETILAYVDNIDLVGNINIVSNNYISSNIDNTKSSIDNTKSSTVSTLSSNNTNDAQARASEAARLAKIEADRIAIEKARLAESQAAAQAAAQAATTTHTSAS